YFAPILLTERFKNLLCENEAPRVINLSSAAQAAPEMLSMEALNGLAILPDYEGYAQSKLALTMWSFAFAKKNPNIVTIAANPGSLLNTKMVQKAFGHHRASANKGADILCRLALSEKHAQGSGKYFDNDLGSYN